MACVGRSGEMSGAGDDLVRNSRYICVVERVADGAGSSPRMQRAAASRWWRDGVARAVKSRRYGIQGLTRTSRGHRRASQMARYGIWKPFMKRVVTGVAKVLGLLLVAALTLAIAQSVSGIERVYTDVVVKPGDTLWVIAQRASDGQRDIRAVVDQIREINGLESVMLRPGQTLKVPYYR